MGSPEYIVDKGWDDDEVYPKKFDPTKDADGLMDRLPGSEAVNVDRRTVWNEGGWKGSNPEVKEGSYLWLSDGGGGMNGELEWN